MCKYLLEVNKRATTTGVMGELGRLPLMLEVIVNMISFYVRLHDSNDILLKDAFLTSESLHQNHKSSWIGCIHVLLSFLGITASRAINKTKPNRKLIFQLLKEKYKNIWHDQVFKDYPNLDHGSKLRTYRKFKCNFSFENYLSWGDYRKRKILTKFRISAHDLEIEKGRHSGIKLNQRLCKLCSLEVEDEVHFLLKCPKLDIIRTSHLNQISLKFKNFDQLKCDEKFIWLMSSEDHYIYNQLYTLICNLKNEKFKLLNT